MANETKTESNKVPPLKRKQKKDLGRRIWSDNPSLEVVHRDAAGIDIGSREHLAAVGPDRDAQPVRNFGCFTEDLHRQARWLQECGVKTVVMQSTGVYWIPVYDVLEQYGFDLWLVNARETRNLPGRKSDVQESQWLLKLHTYGLLRRSFRPTAEIRAIRSCWRERAEYVQQAGVCVQRMQKALTEMNVQLTTVLSDLSGLTGMKIIRASVGGEREGKNLAEFRDPKVKASKETIAKSLEGTWLPEQLAIVARQLADWDHVQKQMAACDKDLEALLKEMPAAEVKPVDPVAAEKTAKRQRKKASKNQPGFDIAGEMKRVAGVDLTRIDGIKLTVSRR
jgi:transposase